MTLKKRIHLFAPMLAMAACGGDASPGGAADAGQATQVVPSESAALFAFLQGRAYEAFEAEPAVHDSLGPHGQVRSFFNDKLAASLTANAESHPVGSATVKELHSDGSLSGWAAMIKTQDEGQASDWYYYEVLSTSDNSPVADGQGVSGCANCHAAGSDYIRTGGP